jgi:hypothetical protein
MVKEKKGEGLRRVGGKTAGYGFIRINKRTSTVAIAIRKGTHG